MSDAPKRIGLIGLSANGSWASCSHLKYLQNTDLYKITALQNSSKVAAEEAARKYEIDDVATYADPTDIALDPDVDIVAVSVKVPQHYKLLCPALRAGKDVFCEWPLGRNLTEAGDLVNMARATGVRTMIGLQARQNPSIVMAKKIVASGKLGKILGTTMYGHGMIFGPKTSEHFLYGLDLEAGANLVTIPFGHAVDALCYVLGEVKDISATLANLRPELDLVDEENKVKAKVKKTAHDYVSMTGRLVEGGGIVDVTYAPGISRTNRSFYWEINGTEGSLVLERAILGGHVQMYQPTLKLALDKEHDLQEVEVGEAADDFSFNVGKAWDAWAGKGLDQGYSVTTWEDALVRHKMIDALYRSAEHGTRENYL